MLLREIWDLFNLGQCNSINRMIPVTMIPLSEVFHLTGERFDHASDYVVSPIEKSNQKKPNKNKSEMKKETNKKKSDMKKKSDLKKKPKKNKAEMNENSDEKEKPDMKKNSNKNEHDMKNKPYEKKKSSKNRAVKGSSTGKNSNSVGGANNQNQNYLNFRKNFQKYAG